MMLAAVIRLSLRYRIVVVLAVAGLALLAAAGLPAAHYGVFPEFSSPSVQIQTNATGLDPREIELAVTDRLERGLGGMPGLATMRSQSSAGLSVINLVFHGGTNVDLDRERVAGRLASLTPTLPPGALPVIMPMQSATGTAVEIGLTAPGMAMTRLSRIAETLIRPALRAVPGVANVVVFGLELPQFEVRMRPSALIESGFGLDAAAKAAKAASGMLGGGFVDTGNQRLMIEAHGQARTTHALADALVGYRDGVPITLNDVAHITEAPPPRYGAALIHGKPGLLLIVSSLYGANTLKVADGARSVLDTLAPALRRDGIRVDPQALAPANFVRKALADLGHVLLIGAGLILVVLLVALRDWRIALISFVSIPVSLLVATLVLRGMGMTLDTMALAGLAIALGEVVDDAIVDIENINRRLIENRALDRPAPVLAVVMRGSMEVRGAVVFATLCVAVMFTPVLALGGVAGRLFAPLGIAYLSAVFASLAVALTLTPALAALLLTRRAGAAHVPMAAARRFYGWLLERKMLRSGFLPLLAGMFVLAMAVSVPFLRTRFLPQFREQDMIVHYLAAPGTSIDTMLSIGRRVAAKLETLPEVADVVEHVGRAALGNGHPDVNKAEIDITLSKRGNAHTGRSEHKIMAAIDGAPGLRWWSNTFLTERIGETISGFTAPLVISVYGSKLADVSRDASRIVRRLRAVPGITAATVAAPPDTPALSIVLRRRAMARLGVSAGSVLVAIRAAYVGERVGQVYRGTLVEPIVVTLPKSVRAEPASLGKLPVANAAGRIVPLGWVASIRQVTAPSLILHEGGRLAQVVTVQSAPGKGSSVFAAVRKRISTLRLNSGDYVAYGGTAVAGAAARLTLLIRAVAAMAVVAVLLGLGLGNARSVMILVAGLPLSLAGGIAAAWIFLGGMLSLGAMVGLVTLFGLTLRNGLLLLIHYRRLVREEGLPWNADTARRGAMDRLPAIVLTASVAALGLVPLAIAAGSPGDEIEGPMAIVILGGLATATVLTLLLLPRLAARFIRFPAKADDGLG